MEKVLALSVSYFTTEEDEEEEDYYYYLSSWIQDC
jgi:hypothetical protein